VELATRYLPDVIILDLSLPEFNGLQVVEELRARHGTKNIPILINTGTVLTEEERRRMVGDVQAITSKTEHRSMLAELKRLVALNE